MGKEPSASGKEPSASGKEPKAVQKKPSGAQPTNSSFPRRHRLIHAREFERLLRRPQVRLKSGPLRLNLVFNRMQHARLGLIVGKKAVARASARNRIKRVIRDRFRTAELPAVDLVVRVVGPVDRSRLHRHLDRLLDEIRSLPEPPQAESSQGTAMSGTERAEKKPAEG